MIQLETSRLVLIPFQTEDWEVMHSLFTHPFVRKYLWDDQTISVATVKTILAENKCHFSEEGWGLWQIQPRKAAETVGFVGLWLFFGEKQPQLLYGLLPNYTGRGLATEASHEVMHYVFSTLKYDFLTASMDKPHVASQRVAERLGMKQYDERLENGKPTLFYRINRRDYW